MFFFKTVHNFFLSQLHENVDWSNLIPKRKTDDTKLTAIKFLRQS